jgi:hypothetical protein
MLADIDRDGWELESAEARVAAYGSDFLIASRSSRESLAPGDQAKLLFRIRTAPGEYEASEHVERMWVTVTERDDDEYSGQLDNEPRYPGRTYFGMPVRFRAELVVEVWRDGHPEPEPLQAAVLYDRPRD